MTKPLDWFRYREGELCSDGVSIRELAKVYGTPLYVYSAEAFCTPVVELQKELRAINPLICFAVKACSNLSVLKLLGEAGAGMDLVSEGELFRALKAGVRPDKMVFSGVGKTRTEMEAALRYPLHSFNVESIEELRMLDALALERKLSPRVALRFNPDVNAKTHPYISTGLKKNKFGLNREEIMGVVRGPPSLKAVRIAGLSIHIGSQIEALGPFADAFSKLKKLAATLDELLPAPLEFLDLGGGLGVRYETESPPTIRQYAQLILEKFGPRAEFTRPYKILLEPGRTVAANAGILVTQVLFRKKRTEKDFLIVDAGMNDLIRPALYESFHGVIALEESLNRGRKSPTDLVGPVCETADRFTTDRMLSPRLKAGDFLAILSCGAYGMSMSSNYNSRNRPAEVMIAQGKSRIIRRRETFADQIRLEDV